jgi:hypothetical protein
LQPTQEQTKDTSQSPLLEEQATRVIDFDPATIPVNEQPDPQPAQCGPSVVIPSAGAYRCSTQSGGAPDPCFVVKDDNILACNPNPAFGFWSGALLQATNQLPPAPSQPSEPVIFYLDIGSNNPPCEKRSPEQPLTVAGQPVSFTCQAPGAWVIGPIDNGQPTWTVQYVITSSDGSSVTYGPTTTPIVWAWRY